MRSTRAMLAEGLRGQEDQPEGRAARPERRRRARQHLCLRGAAPRASVAEAHGLDHRDRKRRAERARRAAGRCDQGGAQRRDRGRRLVAARPSPDRRRARLFPAPFRVYDREGEPCPTPGCKGTIKRIVQSGRGHVFLSGLPEMNLTSSGGARARLEGWRQTPESAAILGSGCALTPQDERLSPFHVNRLYASTIRSSDAADESCMPAWIARIRKEAPCCWGFEAEAENTPAARAKGRGYVCIP